MYPPELELLSGVLGGTLERRTAQKRGWGING